MMKSFPTVLSSTIKIFLKWNLYESVSLFLYVPMFYIVISVYMYILYHLMFFIVKLIHAHGKKSNSTKKYKVNTKKMLVSPTIPSPRGNAVGFLSTFMGIFMHVHI